MGSFNWIQSHQKILVKNTNKTRTKNSLRKNIDLFIQKKSEADNRLIDYKDNTHTHIILKTDDFITEKSRNQKNLNVVLSGFVGNKDNSDHVNARGKKVEELLKLGLKVKDNELKGTAFSSIGNFGLGINEHIDLRLKYEPNIGIYGMGFFTVLARKGKRVDRRKHQRSRLGNFQKVTKEDAKNWFKEKLKGTII